MLDCGVGTGAFSGALARTSGLSLQIDGVDIAPGKLVRADATFARAGVVARLHRRPVHDLEVPDGTFPLVISAHMIEHLSDPLAGLREMSRVLRPDGVMLIVVTRRGIVDALMHLKWRHARISAARLGRWMAASGLEDLRVYPVGSGVPHATSVALMGRKSTKGEPSEGPPPPWTLSD